MLEFEQFCAELNIPLFVNPLATPKYNGGVERGNKIFREEFYANPNLLADSLNAMKSSFKEAVKKYNNYRTHQSLNGLTLSCYIQRYSGASLSQIGGTYTQNKTQKPTIFLPQARTIIILR